MYVMWAPISSEVALHWPRLTNYRLMELAS